MNICKLALLSAVISLNPASALLGGVSYFAFVCPYVKFFFSNIGGDNPSSTIIVLLSWLSAFLSHYLNEQSIGETACNFDGSLPSYPGKKWLDFEKNRARVRMRH